MEAHWRNMVMKQEAVHIQETKEDADDHWEKWHLCPKCEAVETGQTEAEVMETTFKKPTEHKKNRVQHYKEVIEKEKNLLKSKKRNLQEREATASKCGKENLLKSTKKSSSLQEDKELEVGHGLVSATVSANVVSANLVPFILFTNRGLSTNRCCVLKSVEEH